MRCGNKTIVTNTNSIDIDPNIEYNIAFISYEDPDETPISIPETDNYVDSTGKLLDQYPFYDRILNAEVQLQIFNEITTRTVKRLVTGPDGKVIRTYDDNPFINTMLYEIEFDDG